MKVYVCNYIAGKTKKEIKEEYELINEMFNLNNNVEEHEITKNNNFSKVDWNKIAQRVVTSDVVVFTKGFEKSHGCKITYELAKEHKKSILLLN